MNWIERIRCPHCNQVQEAVINSPDQRIKRQHVCTQCKQHLSEKTGTWYYASEKHG